MAENQYQWVRQVDNPNLKFLVQIVINKYSVYSHV